MTYTKDFLLFIKFQNVETKSIEDSMVVKIDKTSIDENQVPLEHDQKSKQTSEVKGKLETLTESDNTKELVPKFQVLDLHNVSISNATDYIQQIQTV